MASSSLPVPMLLSPMFSPTLGSKQSFLSQDMPFESNVVAAVYSPCMLFPCMQNMVFNV